MLSPILTVFELTVVVVPLIVKSPVTTTFPLALISLKDTSSVVPTLCPIATDPSVIVTPVPPAKCALVSEALGPVYVITPEVLLYANEPSPPESVTETDALERVSV